MAVHDDAPRTRRALLLAALGAGAATVASAIGRPLPARAGVDGDLILGTSQNATAGTELHNQTTDDFVLLQVDNAGGNVGLWGQSAHSTTNPAFTNAVAVYGYSDLGIAVQGRGNTAAFPAIVGLSYFSATGVYGFSGPVDPTVTNSAKTGVFGYAIQDSSSKGVLGQTTAGRGVQGQATSGLGVRGYATSGIGGSFEATTGYALAAKGRVRLDNCSGIATINSGNISVTVAPGIDLTTASAAVATLQASAGGTTTVHRCVVNATANTITIYLTAHATVNVRVAWHVFG